MKNFYDSLPYAVTEFFDFIKDCVAALLIIGILIALLVGGITYGLVKPSCYAQWRDSGLPVRWSFFGDCQLQQPDGAWITDSAYIALNKNVKVLP